MVGVDYVFHHMECVLAALRNDKSAIDRMDISADGFWRSFAAIIYSLPALFFTWVVGARNVDNPFPDTGIVARVAYDAVFDIGLWLVLISALVLIIGQLGFSKRVTHFVVARNWTTGLFNYFVAMAFIPQMLTGQAGTLDSLVILFAVGLMVWGFIRVTRLSLQSGSLMATALVCGEVAFVIALSFAIY